jgi:hypothetical protein
MSEEQISELIRILEARFGGLDFWRLTKEWKLVKYEQVARELQLFFSLSNEN